MLEAQVGRLLAVEAQVDNTVAAAVAVEMDSSAVVAEEGTSSASAPSSVQVLQHIQSSPQGFGSLAGCLMPVHWLVLYSCYFGVVCRRAARK